MLAHTREMKQKPLKMKWSLFVFTVCCCCCMIPERTIRTFIQMGDGKAEKPTHRHTHMPSEREAHCISAKLLDIINTICPELSSTWEWDVMNKKKKRRRSRRSKSTRSRIGCRCVWIWIYGGPLSWFVACDKYMCNSFMSSLSGNIIDLVTQRRQSFTKCARTRWQTYIE